MHLDIRREATNYQTRMIRSNLVDGRPTVIERDERLLDRNHSDRELRQNAGEDVGVDIQSRVVWRGLDGVVCDHISISAVSQSATIQLLPAPKRPSPGKPSTQTYTL